MLVTGEDVRALAIGVSGSLVSWFALQRVRVRYEWSPYISERLATETEPARWAIKVRRRGPRNLVDARLHVVLRFRGLWPARPRAIRNVPVPSREWLPYVGRSRAFDLNPGRADPHEVARLPPHIRRLLERPDVTLREILDMPGIDVRLQAHLIGFDSFSGARCIYSSREWTLHDIRRGGFRVGGTDIIPWSDDPRVDPYDFGDD